MTRPLSLMWTESSTLTASVGARRVRRSLPVSEDDEPVLVNPEHGIWISELARVFDVTWATAWNDDANRLLAPLLGIAR